MKLHSLVLFCASCLRLAGTRARASLLLPSQPQHRVSYRPQAKASIRSIATYLKSANPKQHQEHLKCRIPLETGQTWSGCLWSSWGERMSTLSVCYASAEQAPSYNSQIIKSPEESTATGGFNGCSLWPTHWLAIRTAIETPTNMPEQLKEQANSLIEQLLSLRALSQTCKRLRSYTLPLLWASASVDSFDEVGRLRETLRHSPGLAAHIRSFRFTWNPEWIQYWEWYSKGDTRKQYKPLDLAFRNRYKMWLDLGRKLGAEIEHRITLERNPRPQAFFKHRGIESCAPGKPPLIDGRDPKEVSSYDWSAPRLGDISGPDGKGEDRLIKNPKDFNSCIIEICSQLTSLEAFSWQSSQIPLPRAAFDALAKLPRLARLHPRLLMDNGDVHPREYRAYESVL